MDGTSASANRDRWQRYKEWLIAETAGTEYAADGDVLEHMYEQRQPPWDDTSRCEARAWMKNPFAPGFLAVNRFNTHEAGLAFIESLYALGAKAVYVSDIDEVVEKVSHRQCHLRYSDAVFTSRRAGNHR